MPEWTTKEEERIIQAAQEIINNPHPRIRSNRLRKLRTGIENYKAAAERHNHDAKAVQKYRREIKVLSEIINRVKEAQLETDNEDDV